MQAPEDLNDLRLVAWIAETGSLAGAAKRLGVNHATVFRRLNHLEERTKTRLFERTGGRYHATPAGEELALAGAEMELAAKRALLRVAGHDLRPSGQVRVTTTDTFALTLLPQIIALCRARYPQITLTAIVENRSADLSKRDADIALRPTAKPPDHLIGKLISPIEFCVYGEPGYLEKNIYPPQDGRHTWIALDDSFNGHPTLRWMESFVDFETIGYRTSSFGMVRKACEVGLGLALLPSILGDESNILQRVGDPVQSCSTPLWLLIHPDLRNTTRVKAVFDLMYEALRKSDLNHPITKSD